MAPCVLFVVFRLELFLSPEKVEKKGLHMAHLSHGSKIVTLQSGNEDLADCDALMTENHEFSLGIKTADCAPVCFNDEKRIGIAHVGWRGLCLGLIEKMMTHFDTAALTVYVAPFLHSFEIQKDFCYEQIIKKFGERHFERQSDKLIFNFKDAIGSLLPPQAVCDPRNTATELSFPSHRRKTNSRFVTVVSFP